jgi:hypothetical protein
MNNHEEILEAIAGVSRLSTEQMELAAIWLEKPLQMASKRSIRIAPGDEVRVRRDYLAGPCLVDCTEILQPTHVITFCRGTIYSTLLEVDVKDLKTGEILTIKL